MRLESIVAPEPELAIAAIDAEAEVEEECAAGPRAELVPVRGDQFRAFAISWNLGKVNLPPRFLTRPVEAKAAGDGLSSPKSCDTGVPICGTG